MEFELILNGKLVTVSRDGSYYQVTRSEWNEDRGSYSKTEYPYTDEALIELLHLWTK